MMPNYSIVSEYNQDIKGSDSTYSFLLCNGSSLLDNKCAIFEKIKSESSKFKESIFCLNTYYRGSSWLFINEFNIKTDSILHTYTCEHPIRNVHSGSVTERAYFYISESTIENILKADSISIQFLGILKKLPRNGIDSLKSFIRLK
jgi:hypothetical protein